MDVISYAHTPSYADTRVQIFLPSQTPRIRVRFRHPCRIPSVICRVLEKFAESDTRIRVGHRHSHPCPCNTGSFQHTSSRPRMDG
uniref:Uncharacterized protein n=1 Tax=Arundo donax TaxID=35708 RepID=A0A0A9CRU6_ARUDO